MSFDALAGMVTVRPLDPGHQRSGVEVVSPFTASWTSTVELLARELTALKATGVVLQLEVHEGQLRADGLVRADARISYPGVVLTCESRHGQLRYACDRFYNYRGTAWQENVRAIALGLEALRKVDRYGITRSGEQYAGFRALPEGGGIATGMTLTDAYQVIEDYSELGGIDHDDPDAWKYVAKIARSNTHPDINDGDRVGWDRVEQAIAVIERTRGSS